ncbi:hypothetical protein SprV_0301050000 [Sparganum proliferum]
MLAHDAYRDELVRRDRIYVSMVITIGGRACGTLLFEVVHALNILYGCGDDGHSIYGDVFEDENFSIKHDKRGILGMANKGRHTNASQFFITFKPARWMDFRYVAFGHVLEGWNTLEAMEHVPTVNERPVQEIKIAEVKVLAGKDIHDKLR